MEGYDGITIQSQKEKRGKPVTINIINPDETFLYCQLNPHFQVIAQLFILPEILGSFRHGMGFTEKEIGDIIGKWHKSIPEIEEGRKDVTLTDIKYFADALGLDIKVLITKKQDKNVT